MPEVVVDFITSLDGYAAADGWPGWWGLQGPEYLAWLEQNPEREYAILMGANTYRMMSSFTKEGEPGTDVLTGMSKVVFSNTLTEPLEWENSTLVAGDAVEAVREVRQNGERSMRTLGRAGIVGATAASAGVSAARARARATGWRADGARPNGPVACS